MALPSSPCTQGSFPKSTSCRDFPISVLLLVMPLIKMAPKLLQACLVCGVQGRWGVIDGESPLDELSFRCELY